MKKNFLKAGKKTLSVFLTCLMLMTCWVFVAPEQNKVSAASVAETNKNALATITGGSTEITYVYGSYKYDTGTYSDEQKATVYNKVLYSPQSDGTNYSAAWTNFTMKREKNYAYYHYPETVLAYDSDNATNPASFGVSLEKHCEDSNRYVTLWCGYFADGGGLTFANSNWWYTNTEATGSGQYRQPKFYDIYLNSSLNKQAGSATSTVNSNSYYRGSSGWTHFLANKIQFTGTMDNSTYIKTITPTLGWIMSQDTGDTKYSNTAKATRNVYVINVIPWKAAVAKALQEYSKIDAHPEQYTTKSVAKYCELATALLKTNPNNYITATSNNATGWATAAKTAVDNYNAWSGLEVRKYDVQAENLFSFADWYDSQSNNGNVASANVDTGTLTIAATTTDGEKVTGHSGSSTRTQTFYAIPVDGGQNYTIEWTTSSTSTAADVGSEVFAFFYDTNGAAFSDWAAYSPDGGANGTYKDTVTAPAKAAYMELRFDNNNNKNANTMTFSNIKVYKTSRATEIARQDWISGLDMRKVYTYGQTVGTLDTPVRKGYRFDGWQFDTNGDGIGDTAVLSSKTVDKSYPVYSTWTQKTLDIGYDNLFSVSGWGDAAYGKVTNRGGAITVDAENGTISIENPINANGNDNNYTAWEYSVPVDTSTEYIFVYDTDIVGATGTQIHIFYKTSENATSYTGFPESPYVKTEGHKAKNTIVFTPPEGTTHVSFRFGTTDGSGMTNTFSNIGLYKKADYDAYAKDYTKVREPFKYGDTTDLMTPKRAGYVFDGWYTAGGTKLENVTGLYESDIVYAHWTKTRTVTFLNGSGNAMHTVTVVNGKALDSDQYPTATPTKASDATNHYTFAGWNYVDGTPITSDLTIIPNFTPKAHGNFKYTLMTEPTCEKNATVKKVCDDCNYNFGNVEFDGDISAYPEYAAKGHDFVGQPAVQGSSNGTQHKVLCSRYTTESCGGETYVDHVWNFVNTTGATCTEKGKNHYQCACLATKDEDGVIAPNVHVNTEVINKSDATCTDKGYTGDTYCNDCKQTVTTGTDIAALGHKWENTKTNIKDAATCTTDAVYYQECSVCKISAKDDTTETGTTWTDEGSALGHNWIETTDDAYLATSADCENDATYYYDCSRCEESSKGNGDTTWTKENTATGHDFTGAIVSDNNGKHGNKCSRCDVVGNTVECTYGAWTTNNADTHSHTCTLCNYTPAATAHTWSNWVTVDSATDAEPAQHTRSCSTCNKTQTESCSNHTEVVTKATCTVDGYTTHKCPDCGHEYYDEVTTATGHNFTGEYKNNANTDVHQQLCANGCGKYGVNTTDDEGKLVAKEGVWTACTWTYENKEAGTHTATCVCGNSQDEECSGGEATCTTPATCEKCEEQYGTTAPHNYAGTAVKLDGDVHAYLCKYCGENNTDETNYGVGEEKGATEACSGGTATCSALAVCDICGDTYGELDTENHKYGDAKNVEGTETHKYTCEYNSAHTLTEDCVVGSQEEVLPDCESEGYIVNTCEKCSHEWISDEVAQPGHKWSAWVSNGDGTHTRTCVRSGCKYGENGTAATETVYCTVQNATAKVTDPTCTEKGYTTYTCKDCGYKWTDKTLDTDPTGHHYENKRQAVSAAYLRTEQTCTQALTYWYRCDNCNVSAETCATITPATESDYYWVSKEASSHSFTKKTATEDYLKSGATCTTRASYYYSCSACGATSKDENGERIFYSGSVLGHDWIEDELYLASAADCVNDATYYKHCLRCNDVSSETWTKANSKTGHDFDANDDGEVDSYTKAAEATCIATGVLAHYTCLVCGKNYEDADATKELTNVTVKALGHKWQSVGYQAATCEEAGHTSHKECSVCHQKDSDYKAYEATGHNFSGDYVYHENGYHSKLCVNTDCTESGWEDTKYSVTTDETTGETEVIAGAVQCTFGGEYTHVVEDDVHYHSQACVCGNTKKTECTEKETVVTDPTCTEDGYTTHGCSVCGETWQTDIFDALGHDTADKATSNEDGKTHSVKCSNCEYKTDAENCYGGTATCNDKATCAVCGQKYGEIGEHTLAEDGWTSNEDATCTANGTESQACSVCGEVQKRTEADSALGHHMTVYSYDVSDWTNGSAEVKATIKAPTCAAEGKAISYCIRCDYYITRTVAKLKDSHVWKTDQYGNEVWEYVSGDCSTYITYKCECVQCGAVKTKKEQIDHKWTTVVTKVEPTCVKDGYRTIKCGNCGAQKTEILESVEHKWGAWSTYTDATCCEAEVEIRTCSVCKNTETQQGDEPATGIHDASSLVKWQAEPATCDTDGFIEHYRSSCGKYFLSSDKGKTFTEVEWSQIYRAATNHADNNGDGKCDSCNTVIGSGSVGNDSCVCHKTNWFMKMIYSILKTFWKIFGINKTCACGIAHY